MPLGMEVGLGPGHIVLDGDPAPPPEKEAQPHHFSAHVYYGQTVGCIRIPLGMEVGLSLGDNVLDGDSATPKKGYSPTQFLAHVYCVQMAGWKKMPLGTGVYLGPGHIVLGGDRALPRERGTAAPLFSAHVYCGHGRPSQLLLSSCFGC